MLVKQRITLLRYVSETILTAFGLEVEINRMFYSIGLLEFMQREAPTFERITLKFLSALDFKLQSKYIDGTRYYHATLKFQLFNQNRELNA